MRMSLLDQISASGERYDQANRNDYAQVLPKLPTITPQKPSMSTKLIKVAEIFELDIIDAEEALKACQVIIGQHTKVDARSGTGSTGDAKIVK